jgi:hypothetical protein
MKPARPPFQVRGSSYSTGGNEDIKDNSKLLPTKVSHLGSNKTNLKISAQRSVAMKAGQLQVFSGDIVGTRKEINIDNHQNNIEGRQKMALSIDRKDEMLRMLNNKRNSNERDRSPVIEKETGPSASLKLGVFGQAASIVQTSM